MPCLLTTGVAPCCSFQNNNNLQDKDSLPKGRLSQSYKEGVLFVTYSLLAMGNQVPGVKTGPLAKALHVGMGLGRGWMAVPAVAGKGKCVLANWVCA